MAPPRRRSFRKIRSKKNSTRSKRRTLKPKPKKMRNSRVAFHRLLVNIL